MNRPLTKLRPKTAQWIVGAATGLVMVALVSAWIVNYPDRDSRIRQPSGTQSELQAKRFPDKVVYRQDGEVASIPDIRKAVEGGMADALAGSKEWVDPHHSSGVAQYDVWILLSSSKSRYLIINASVEKSSAKAETNLSQLRRSRANNRLKGEGEGVAATGSAEKVEIGDDGFLVVMRQRGITNPFTPDDRKYDMGGVFVAFRQNNVLVTIQWEGADYPADMANRRSLSGRNLPETKAKGDTVRLAQSIASSLART